jgi:hypothetical protein
MSLTTWTIVAVVVACIFMYEFYLNLTVFGFSGAACKLAYGFGSWCAIMAIGVGVYALLTWLL